jgi:23S rRNA (cytidine2498-2'-O)-methyltransferase
VTPFGVQVRYAPKAREKLNFPLRNEITAHLEQLGFSLNTRHPHAVISLFCSAEGIYLGISKVGQNLSAWSGGLVNYALREDTISRSEFKLKEAIEHFALELPQAGLALDLGAAPGGWSKVLIEEGLSVLAVDPGELSPKIRHHPRLCHYRGSAQSYLEVAKPGFVLLVNDMKLDITQSVELTLGFSDFLLPEAKLVMTFKLPKTKKSGLISKGLTLLERRYEVLARQQLSHNRSEITVVARLR